MSDQELLRALIFLLVKKSIISIEELESIIEKIGRSKLSDILLPEEIEDIRDNLKQYARELDERIKSIHVTGWASALYRHGLEENLKFIEKNLENLENLPIRYIDYLRRILESSGYKNKQVLRKLTILV